MINFVELHEYEKLVGNNSSNAFETGVHLNHMHL